MSSKRPSGAASQTGKVHIVGAGLTIEVQQSESRLALICVSALKGLQTLVLAGLAVVGSGTAIERLSPLLTFFK